MNRSWNRTSIRLKSSWTVIRNFTCQSFKRPRLRRRTFRVSQPNSSSNRLCNKVSRSRFCNQAWDKTLLLAKRHHNMIIINKIRAKTSLNVIWDSSCRLRSINRITVFRRKDRMRIRRRLSKRIPSLWRLSKRKPQMSWALLCLQSVSVLFHTSCKRQTRQAPATSKF